MRGHGERESTFSSRQHARAGAVTGGIGLGGPSTGGVLTDDLAARDLGSGGTTQQSGGHSGGGRCTRPCCSPHLGDGGRGSGAPEVAFIAHRSRSKSAEGRGKRTATRRLASPSHGTYPGAHGVAGKSVPASGGPSEGHAAGGHAHRAALNGRVPANTGDKVPPRTVDRALGDDEPLELLFQECEPAPRAELPFRGRSEAADAYASPSSGGKRKHKHKHGKKGGKATRKVVGGADQAAERMFAAQLRGSAEKRAGPAARSRSRSRGRQQRQPEHNVARTATSPPPPPATATLPDYRDVAVGIGPSVSPHLDRGTQTAGDAAPASTEPPKRGDKDASGGKRPYFPRAKRTITKQRDGEFGLRQYPAGEGAPASGRSRSRSRSRPRSQSPAGRRGRSPRTAASRSPTPTWQSTDRRGRGGPQAGDSDDYRPSAIPAWPVGPPAARPGAEAPAWIPSRVTGTSGSEPAVVGVPLPRGASDGPGGSGGRPERPTTSASPTGSYYEPAGALRWTGLEEPDAASRLYPAVSPAQETTLRAQLDMALQSAREATSLREGALERVRQLRHRVDASELAARDAQHEAAEAKAVATAAQRRIEELTNEHRGGGAREVHTSSSSATSSSTTVQREIHVLQQQAGGATAAGDGNMERLTVSLAVADRDAAISRAEAADDAVKSLRAEVDALLASREEAAAFRRERDAALAREAELKQEAVVLRTQTTTFREELSASQTEVSRLQAALVAEKQSASRQRDDGYKAAAQSQQAADTARAEADSLRQELHRSRAQSAGTAAAAAEASGLRDELRKVRAELDAERQKATRGNAAADDARRDAAEARTRAAASASALASERDSATVLRARIAELEAKLQSAVAEARIASERAAKQEAIASAIGSAKAENARLQSQLESQAMAHSQFVSRLEARAQSESQSMTHIVREREEMSRRCGELEASSRVASDQLAEARGALEEAESARRAAEEVARGLTVAVADARRDLAAEKQTSLGLQERLKHLEKEVRAASRQVSSEHTHLLDARMRELETRLHTMTAENAALMQTNDRILREKAEIHSRMSAERRAEAEMATEAATQSAGHYYQQQQQHMQASRSSTTTTRRRAGHSSSVSTARAGAAVDSSGISLSSSRLPAGRALTDAEIEAIRARANGFLAESKATLPGGSLPGASSWQRVEHDLHRTQVSMAASSPQRSSVRSSGFTSPVTTRPEPSFGRAAPSPVSGPGSDMGR